MNFYLPSDIEEIVTRLPAECEQLAGRTMLLTGGCGFLGRYFVEVVAALNQRVFGQPLRLIIVDNLITAGEAGSELVDRPAIRFVEQDVTEAFDPGEDIDIIVHAAGIASPFHYRAYPLETLDVAIVGTRRMLELATRHKAQFCFFSSSEIYGDPVSDQVPTQESYRGNVTCQGPRACYDESKRVGETLCYIFEHSFGVASNIIRPFNVFGPGMQETDYRAMPNFASNIKAGLPLSVYGDGNQTRTFCYITDALVGFFRVILKGVRGETYNIGNPTPEVSMLDLVSRIEEVLGTTMPYRMIEHPDTYPEDEPRRRCPDIRKARIQLGFEPQVDLNDGLQRFLSWADGEYRGQS